MILISSWYWNTNISWTCISITRKIIESQCLCYNIILCLPLYNTTIILHISFVAPSYVSERAVYTDTQSYQCNCHMPVTIYRYIVIKCGYTNKFILISLSATWSNVNQFCLASENAILLAYLLGKEMLVLLAHLHFAIEDNKKVWALCLQTNQFCQAICIQCVHQIHLTHIHVIRT